MDKKLKETYKLADKLFPYIGNSCKNCNTCCKTYGWLLKREAEGFLKKGYSVIEINKHLYCFDSFVRDKNNKRIFNQIPRCPFYKKGECSIYEERPIDCRLYPVKIKFRKGKVLVGLSLGCKYVSSLSEERKNELYDNIVDFFKKAPQIVINDYLDLMEGVNSISRLKKFWMREIAEIEKQGGFWKILK